MLQDTSNLKNTSSFRFKPTESALFLSRFILAILLHSKIKESMMLMGRDKSQFASQKQLESRGLLSWLKLKLLN